MGILVTGGFLVITTHLKRGRLISELNSTVEGFTVQDGFGVTRLERLNLVSLTEREVCGKPFRHPKNDNNVTGAR